MLKEANCPHILNTGSETFAEDLKKMCAELKPSHLLCAVGGELTGTILEQMPPGATAIVYGVLSFKPIGNISGLGLIF